MTSSIVSEIKQRLPIADVLKTYIVLNAVGVNYKAKCPFHNEKTPSFFVSTERNSFYCFGCGVKGDVFTFVEKFEGLDFKGSLKVLAEKAGVSLGEYVFEKQDSKDELYKVMQSATAFYAKKLEEKEEALAYVLSRGLTKETITSFSLGYAPDDWRSLFTHLTQKGFSPFVIEKAGLIKKTEKGYYDRFRDRIMFPINDSTGRPIAFSGRSLKTGDTIAKYLNSPETTLFSKSSVFFGFDKAKEHIRKKNYSILVEGQFDLVLLHQYGFENSIATSGTAFRGSKEDKNGDVTHLGIINRLSSNIVLAFDSDSAGLKATYRAAKEALPLGMEIKILELPVGLDPAEILLKDKNVWVEALKNTTVVLEYFITKIAERSLDPQTKVKKIKETIFPLIQVLPGKLEKETALMFVHARLGLSKEALLADFLSYERTHTVDTQKEEKLYYTDAKLKPIERFVAVIFSLEDNPDPNISLVKECKEIIGEDQYEKIYQLLLPKKDEYIFKTDALYQSTEQKILYGKELLKRIEHDTLRERLKNITQSLYTAEQKGLDTKKYLEESQKIMNSLKTNNE